jgi:ectoine hydroxylase-related dioxygenase (phytanoyl-CoA dioxygenase family)
MISPITTLTDWVGELENNGVAKIENVFGRDEINELRCKCWNAFREASCLDIQWRGDFPALVFLREKRWVDKFAKHEKLAWIVKRILGPEVVQLNKQIYFRLPGDGDQFNWHQDITFRIPKQNFVGIEEGYIQTAIVVDPMTEDNSPIMFVHGSHQFGELDLVPRDGTEQGLREFRDNILGQPMIANPGDVLVWNVCTVHGSRVNNSDRSRMYLMNGFAKKECVLDQSYPTYLSEGELV